jgi:hypothetical protein
MVNYRNHDNVFFFMMHDNTILAVKEKDKEVPSALTTA